MSLPGQPFCRIAFLGFLLCLPAGAPRAETAIEALLARVPADNQAEDSNLYSLTDVQGAMGAALSWNALLRRAVLVEKENNVVFAISIGSRVGRVGSEIVEWQEAPTLRHGEIYVSQSLLETVFSRNPKYRLPGQSAEDVTPTPAISEIGGEDLPEEPPQFVQDTNLQIRTLLALAAPSSAAVASASGDSSAPARRLVEALEKKLEGSGIQVKSAVWNPAAPEKSYLEADALVAFRVVSATPPAKAVFFYYDAGSPPGDGGGSGLVEWSRVSLNYQQASRTLGDLLHRAYQDTLGATRTAGLRNGPIDLLQGRQVPSVLISLGISPASGEVEIRRTADVIGNSLVSLKKG